jgi:Arc/MetJ-type ribon-helix-helix transcriptional regulator
MLRRGLTGRCTTTRKTRNLSIRLPEEMYAQVKSSQVNWSDIIRAAIRQFLNGEFELVTTATRPALRPTAPVEAEAGNKKK